MTVRKKEIALSSFTKDRSSLGRYQKLIGFKAYLSDVCGCQIYIVGRTKKDVLENLARHMRDVHHNRQLEAETQRRLGKVLESIG